MIVTAATAAAALMAVIVGMLMAVVMAMLMIVAESEAVAED